ncbi:hypothetical protein, partial [Streptomyces malaysiensis]
GAVRILHTCAAALPDGGRVLIAERVFHDEPASVEELSEARRLTTHVAEPPQRLVGHLPLTPCPMW